MPSQEFSLFLEGPEMTLTKETTLDETNSISIQDASRVS